MARDTDTEFKEKILEVIRKNARRIPVPVFIVVLYVLIAARNHPGFSTVIAWFVVVTIAIFARRIFVPKICKHHTLQVDDKLRYIQYITLSSGLAYAILVVFFPRLSLIDQSLSTMLLIGLCTGAIFSTASYKPILRSIVIPVTLALVIHWVFRTPELPLIKGVYISLIILLYMSILYSFGDDILNLYRDSYLLSAEQQRLNAQLIKALENEEKANRAKTRFLAAASHDLRQPLNALAIYITTLELQQLDEKSKKISSQLSKAINLLSAQMDSLLDISRLDAGITKISHELIDIKHLLLELKTEFELVVQEKNLELTVEVHDSAYVYSDHIQLTRVIRNLLSNAIKFTDSGSIRLSTEHTTDDENVLVIITDTGCGIDEAELDNVFDEFYQLQPTKAAENSGLGLGLSIVRRLCTRLKIGLNIESELNRGTRVTLTLPSATTDLSASAANASATAKADTSLFKTLTILVIDDDKSNREGIRFLLEHLGSNVLTASNVGQALDQLKAKTPDLMLVDYRLSNHYTGIDAINKIRRAHPNLPAVLVTGGVEEQNRIEAEQGGIPIIIKPLSLELLTKTVVEMTGSGDN